MWSHFGRMSLATQYQRKILEERKMMGVGSCIKCNDITCPNLEIPTMLKKRPDQDAEFCARCGYYVHDVSLEKDDSKTRSFPTEKEAITQHIECLQRVNKSKGPSSSPPGGPEIKEVEETKEKNEMKINFRALTGRSVEVPIPANWTSTDLIFALARIYHCVQMQKLIARGQLLQIDDVKLSELGLVSGSFVDVILNLRGS